MKFIRGIHNLKQNQQACVATIGNFDGLHLGHRKIIGLLKERSKELNLPLTVISFEPLPSEYFLKDPPARIYPLRDKVRLLSTLGVDNFLCLQFNAALANMPPEKFVSEVLIKNLNVRHLAVGDDFRFGHKRMGDFTLLQKMGKHADMAVVSTATVVEQGERISSTKIRNVLARADIDKANKLLGQRYQLSGRIRQGDKRGRTIGFPTINMKLPGHIAPQKGVYAVRVHGVDQTVISGVANLGSRPTVSGTENRLETHLFNFEGDVYGKYICVELVKFIRPEYRFDSFDKLKQQILLDVTQAKVILELQSD